MDMHSYVHLPFLCELAPSRGLNSQNSAGEVASCSLGTNSASRNLRHRCVKRFVVALGPAFLCELAPSEGANSHNFGEGEGV